MISLPKEILGSFYLGAKYDHKKKEVTSEVVNYDARDLTTHAVCVGMTGSGKTGLCVGLLEEAAIDKVPALIIDPKGDMTNLLLQFENLDPSDFKKWINADDAGRKGVTVDEYAASTAKKWKDGLASWGQDTERIKKLKESVDYTIYTPGSNSGVPINIMGSFAAPGVDFDSDAEMLRERIQGTVAALLGMINSKEDPVRSREGILLSTLFEHYWRRNEDLDLTKIIKGIQKPPMTQMGVFDLDTFFPEKDRFNLAMDFNTLVASPQFRYWLQGDDLDIERLYFTPEGKPRHCIFYIAHLSDSERMFFVTLLLNSLITWMRRQSGTTSLRSLLYFDEIFGFFPPISNPPSKKPLLTLLKQARAYGVGSILVTQNPVDIDYKGLSNAGTWFIGKLQTERDRDRVLQGLESAIAEAGNKSSNDFGNIIGSLDSRVFLMHNVHESEPVIFNTRWVMSYLRGPMTRPQIKALMADKKKGINRIDMVAKPHLETKSHEATAAAVAPSIDPSIEQRYFEIWKSGSEAAKEVSADGPMSLRYDPMILVSAKVRFFDSKRKIDKVEERSFLAPPPDQFGRMDWSQAKQISNWAKTLQETPDYPDGTGVSYGSVPDTMNSAKELSAVSKEYSNWLYQTNRMIVKEHEELDIHQGSEESNEAFVMRLQQAAREKRDDALDTHQEKFAPKFERIKDRMKREENKLEAAEDDAQSRKAAEWIGAAETLFSVFSGRRRSLGSVASRRRMASKANQKVENAQEELEDLQEDFQELEKVFNNTAEEIRIKWETSTDSITEKEISPRRSDVKVESVILAWSPQWVDKKGNQVSALMS